MPKSTSDKNISNLNSHVSEIQKLQAEQDENILYKLFFNESLDLVCIASMDGYFTKINPSFSKLLGYTEEELLQSPFVTFIHTDDVQSTLDELEIMREKGESTLKFENRYLNKNGEIVHLQWNTSLDWENKIIYAVARDCTSEKEIERKLIRSEELMRSAQAISKMGAWSFIIDSGELYWSDELYKIYGIDKTTENLYQEYISRFNEVDYEKLNDHIAEAIMKSKTYFLQHSINLPNNKTKWVYCSGSPVKNKDGKVVKLEGFVQDITDQKNTELTILNNIKEKETLLQELHHRVKNNLQVISSILNLQSNIIENQQVKELFKDSQHRIKSMASVHDLLYKTNNFSHINFSKYIHGLVKDLIYSYKGEDHAIKVDINIPDVSFTIDKAVPIGLFVNEIITNSLKHGFRDTDSGQINFHLNKSQDESYQLNISDDGIGFDKNGSIKKDTLGLLLIESLAEQIDGELNFESSKKGTKFSLSF